MTAVDSLFAAALELEMDERIELAQRLLAACDKADPGWWASVAPDIEGDLKRVDRGEEATLPWHVVRARMYERLNAAPD